MRPNISGDIRRFMSIVDIALNDQSLENTHRQSYDVVYPLIQKALTSNEAGIHPDLFWRFGAALKTYVLLEGLDKKYFQLFEILHDALRGAQTIPPFDVEKPWLQALKIAEGYRQSKVQQHCQLDYFSREAISAESFRKMLRREYQYELNDSGVCLKEDDTKKACLDLEIIISKLGGLNVIGYIFDTLRRSNKIYRGLFLYGRQVSQMPEPRQPTIPWHFLYNLSLKHLTTQSTSRDAYKDFQTLLSLAQDFASCLDVEEYNAFANIGLSPYAINEALQENAVYDELFSFQQWGADKAHILLSWWIDLLKKENPTLLNVPLEAWNTVAQSILTQACPHAPSVVHKSKIQCTGIASKSKTAILDALLVSAHEINKEYQTPFDTPKRNAPFFPIVKIQSRQYLIPPKGISARAFYERIVSLIRAEDPSIDMKLGSIVEQLVERILSETGNAPSVFNGKYNYPDKRHTYEIDVAVETDSYIHLLECKKKILTNAARGGMPPNALVDLSQGFLMPLSQLIRHERALSEKGVITFANGYSLSLADRQVERIIITMLDHGSFQNRQFIRNIILALANVNVHCDDPALNQSLESVNHSMKAIVQDLQELSHRKNIELGKFLHSYCFGTWWLSVDQLFNLCEQGIGLWDTLKATRNVTFGTGDIMNEFAIVENLKVLQERKI